LIGSYNGTSKPAIFQNCNRTSPQGIADNSRTVGITDRVAPGRHPPTKRNEGKAKYVVPEKEKAQRDRDRATMLIMAACMTGMTVGAVSAIFAAPAHASTQDSVKTRIVRHGDLNLASQDGRAVLDQRIRRAAKHVCSVTGVPSILQQRKVRICTEAAHSKAWATAQQRIDKVRLAVRSSE
jgi:UrcA family protein